MTATSRIGLEDNIQTRIMQAKTQSFSEHELAKLAAQPQNKVLKYDIAKTLDEYTWAAKDIRAAIDDLKEQTVRIRMEEPEIRDFALQQRILESDTARWLAFLQRHRFFFRKVTSISADRRDMILIERILEGVKRIQEGKVTKQENDAEIQEDLLALMLEKDEEPSTSRKDEKKNKRQTEAVRRAQRAARMKRQLLLKNYAFVRVPNEELKAAGKFIPGSGLELERLELERQAHPQKPFPDSIPPKIIQLLRMSTEARTSFIEYHGQLHRGLEPKFDFTPTYNRAGRVRPEWSTEFISIASDVEGH